MEAHRRLASVAAPAWRRSCKPTDHPCAVPSESPSVLDTHRTEALRGLGCGSFCALVFGILANLGRTWPNSGHVDGGRWPDTRSDGRSVARSVGRSGRRADSGRLGRPVAQSVGPWSKFQCYESTQFRQCPCARFGTPRRGHVGRRRPMRAHTIGTPRRAQRHRPIWPGIDQLPMMEAKSANFHRPGMAQA